MYKLLETVVLTRDLPQAGLRAGDIGAVVDVMAPGAYEVEFVAVSGRTQALVALCDTDLRSPGDRDVPAVRTWVEAAA
jgi:hypothetical protein